MNSNDTGLIRNVHFWCGLCMPCTLEFDRVTADNSGLCCVHVTSFGHQLTPFISCAGGIVIISLKNNSFNGIEQL